MKLGIIGLPGSGKSTIFEALTGNTPTVSGRAESRIGTVQVPDARVAVLTDMYHPRKTIYAQVEYYLPGIAPSGPDKGKEQSIWGQTRDCDALVHIVRNFKGYGLADPVPYTDMYTIDQELILSDLLVVEKRIERIETDRSRNRETNSTERSLLEECLAHLEEEIPLRRFPHIATAPVLRGFAFLSAKPLLVLFNNDDDDSGIPPRPDSHIVDDGMVIRGKLEQELSQMTAEDAAEFLAEFGIEASAMDRVIKRSYSLLGLISFFTVGEDEVRAWTVRNNTPAMHAAGVIHSDMERGFIRAGVVSYEDLIAAGFYAAARKQGTVRLEGKTYEVQDGDIINVRFNVG